MHRVARHREALGSPAVTRTLRDMTFASEPMACAQRPFGARGTAAFCAICASLVSSAAFAQQGDRAGEAQVELPAEWRVDSSPVRTAEEQLATFALPDGYRIELVASEPLVEAPVAFEFGPDGRLWVVEMRGYMRDADGAGERDPIGRIKVLTDEDGDGRMDRADIFLDGLVMPRGIALWRDGLLVIEPPHLFFARDTDGDGRADRSELVASGFAGEDNPEHAGNGLLYALDNTFACSQHPFRFLVDGASLRVEPVAPHGQWGLSEDALGRLYYSPNSDPLLVDLLPKQHAARNPSQRNFEGVPARAARDTRVHPSHLTPGVNRGYQRGVLREGRLAEFTGACSPHVHEGRAMGADMEGSALVCEVAGNLVHRYRLAEQDGRIVATPADDGRSFLTSTDERFRPVHCESGPDGFIYLADMYRGVIQHRRFMTTFLRTQVEARGLEQPLDAGRIWRIVPEGAAPRRAPNLAVADAATLVGFLSHDEKPVRTMARRLLVERRDPAAIALLREQVLATAPARITLVESLWALAGMGGADDGVVAALLRVEDPVLRVHALRVAERSSDTVTLASFLARAIEDSDPAPRVQAALSAWRLDAPLRAAFLETALIRDIGSREMRSAVLASSRGVEHDLLDAVVAGRLLADEGVASRAFAVELADVLLDDGDGLPSPATLAETVSAAARVGRDRPWLAKAILERVAAKQNLNAKEPRQLVAAAEPEGWGALLDALPADLALASSVDRQLFWPGREDVSFVAPRVARGKELSIEEFGKRLYSNCMSCHQANGRGLPPVYPPLRGSEIVHGDATTLVKIVMHGMEGPIMVDGQRYNQVMPAAPLRTDEEIAAVLTYVRGAWGNAGAPIDAALVSEVREATKGRNRPFTSKELGLHP
jgi:mono/diheme cytochrome c family protein/glucose/arabinose dehydrogenase